MDIGQGYVRLLVETERDSRKRPVVSYESDVSGVHDPSIVGSLLSVRYLHLSDRRGKRSVKISYILDASEGDSGGHPTSGSTGVVIGRTSVWQLTERKESSVKG